MIPHLVPRHCHPRGPTTHFPPPLPVRRDVEPTNRSVDHDDNSNIEYPNESFSGIEILEAASETNHDNLVSLLSASRPQQGQFPHTAPWSPPRPTTTRKDQPNGTAAAVAKNEGCTTPTNTSQSFFDHTKLQHLPSSTSSLSSNWLNDASLALTPPAAAPAPLLVSAKRLGTEVRSLHSKRRRASRRTFLNNSNQSAPHNEDRPPAFDGQLNPRCTLVRRGTIRQFDRWCESIDEEDGNHTDIEHRLSSPAVDIPSDDDDSGEGYPLLPSLLQNLSPQEQKRQYWQLCYGNDPPKVAPTPPNTAVATGAGPMSWSASRAPPSRSCLSSAKKGPSVVGSAVKPSFVSVECWTPETSPNEAAETEAETTTTASHAHKTKSVQFGSPRAAEYDVDAPSVAMTPLPSEVARARFPVSDPEMHPRDPQQYQVELEMIKETKLNTEVLQSWETSFFDFDESFNFDEDEESVDKEPPDGPPPAIGSIFPTMDIDFDHIRARQKRRSSGFFSQSDVSAALLSPSDSDDENNEDDYDSNDKDAACADPNEDISIACHIAALTVKGTTPTSPVPLDPNGIDCDVIPEATPASHSSNSTIQTTPPFDISSIVTDGTPPSEVSYSSAHNSNAVFTKSKAIPNVDAHESVGRALEFDVNTEVYADEKETIDLIQELKNNPDAVRDEWELCDILRTMARYGIPREISDSPREMSDSATGERYDEIGLFLASMPLYPFCDSHIRTGLNAFVSRLDNCFPATCIEPLNSISKVRTSWDNYEWMELECTFWDHVNEGVKKLEEELLSRGASASCASFPDIQRSLPNRRHRSLKYQRKRLESYILQLQDSISEERNSQDLIKAKLRRRRSRLELELALPSSVFTFQMTSAILSFQMVGCTATTAQWRMDHVVEGVESEVTWNIQTGQLCGCLVASDNSFCPQSGKVPCGHVASQLHQILAVRCMEESHHFLHREDDDVSFHREELLPNCLAHLAMLLGRIDMVVRSLWCVASEHQHTISLMSPHSGTTQVKIDLDDRHGERRTLVITFDASTLFLPSKVEYETTEEDSDLALSGRNAVENWRSSQGWELAALFQDILNTSVLSTPAKDSYMLSTVNAINNI